MNRAAVAFAALLFALVFIAPAGATITIQDPYGGTNPGYAANNGDVYGQLSLFDINMVSFTQITPTDVDVEMLFNYDDGDSSLSTFNIGYGVPNLNAGDLLFSMGGNETFGVPLTSHDGLIAGHLYEITSALTAWDVIQYQSPTSTDYRPSSDVWINPIGAVDVGTGTENPFLVDHSEVGIRLSFVPTTAFLVDLGQGMDVHFASATCGNDIIDGHVKIPEPVSMFLLGSGLIGLALIGRRRRS